MSNGLVVGGLYDGDEVVEAEYRILGDHFAAKSVISWFTSSKRSGSLCNFRPPSGASACSTKYTLASRLPPSPISRARRRICFRLRVGDSFKPLRFWQSSVKSHGLRGASGSCSTRIGGHKYPQRAMVSARRKPSPPLWPPGFAFSLRENNHHGYPPFETALPREPGRAE